MSFNYLLFLFLAFLTGLFLLKADILQGVPVSFSSGGAQVNWATATSGASATLPIAASYNIYDSKDAGIVAGTDIKLQSTSYTATDDGTLTTTGSATGGGFANGTNSSTTVSGSGSAASVALSVIASATSTIDSAGNVGLNNDIAVDSNGKAYIAYRDYTNGVLKYATNSSGAWQTSTITVASGANRMVAIALDSNNKAHIVNGGSSCAGLYDVTDKSGSWVSTYIDYPMNYADNVVDSNNKVHIAYGDRNCSDGAQTLRYATDVSGSFVTSTIDATVIAQDVSIALDSAGKVYIAYADYTSGDLKYATNVSGSWAIQTLDTTSNNINGTSIAVVSSSSAHITYGDYTNDVFNYITNASGSWVKTTINPQTSDWNSLKLDSNNKLHVVFDHGWRNQNLKYATNESGSWVVTNIDGPPYNNTFGLGLAIDSNDKYHISYYDDTNDDLKYATNHFYPSSGAFTSATIDLGGAADFTTSSFTQTISGGALGKGWGRNNNGQLGDGTTSQRLTPVSVSGITNAVAVAASIGGDNFSLALLSDGTIKSWGYNVDGQLGNGTTTASYIPVSVSGITNAVAVAAGTYHSLALLSDGTIKGWGWNFDGELGDGTGTTRLTPVSAGSGISNAVAIAAGGMHSLVLLTDGRISAFGGNNYGQLGNGATTNSRTPVFVSGITNAVAVAAGGSYGASAYSLALLSDGTVKAWGNNAYGQLGDGTTTQSLIPVSVSGITNAVAVAAGINHSLALLSDGTVMAWGRNNSGQLGNNSTIDSLTPVTVSGITNAVAIAVGSEGFSSQSLALLSDGTVKAWGDNAYGQLGDGTTNQRLTPVSANITDATAVAAGAGYTLAITGGIRFQIAGNTDNATWNYKPLPRQIGVASNRLVIPPDLDGNRYVRYKAYLATNDTTYTPQLNDITLGYSGYPGSAALTSSKFDTGAANSFVKSLTWTETGVTAAKDVKLQLSAAATSGGLTTFCGPRDGTTGSCTTSTYFTDPTGVSENIDDAQIPGRWFQYKTFLTSDGSGTAALDNINVTYDTVSFQITSSGGGSVSAGTAYPVIIKAMDTQATPAPVTGYDGSKTLTFSGAGTVGANAPKISDDNICGDADDMSFAAAIITFASGVADPPGAETNYYLCAYKAEAVTLSATASSAAIPTTTSLDVTVNASAASVLSFTQQPASTGTVDAAFTTQPILSVTDTYGNPVSGLTVNLSGVLASDNTTTGAGSLTGTTGVATNSSGAATFTGIGYTGTDTIHIKATVTSPALSANSTTNITLGAGAVSLFTLSAPADITAGTEAAYTVTRYDVFNNLVTSGAQTVYLSSNSTGNKQFRATSGGSGVTSVSIADGQSAAAFYYYDDKTGSWTITTSDAAAPDGTTGIDDAADTLGVTPAAASYFTVTSATATPVAGTSFNVTLTAKDPFGNTATGYSAAAKTFTLSGPGSAPIGTAPSYGTNAAIVAAFVNGAAAIPVTLYNRETVSLDVSDGTLNSAGNAAYDADLTVGLAPASKLIYTQQPPASGLANTAFSTQPVVQIQDQYSNLCTTGADAALTVALAAVNATDGTTVLSGALTNGSVTASAGVATFSGLAYNQAGALKLKASSGALTTALSNQVTVTAFDVTAPASGAVWAAGSTQTISWTIYGATAPFSVQYWNGTGWFDVRDAANVPAIAVSGTTQQWKIPVNMTISAAAKVRIFDNDAPGSPAESAVFSISGGLALSAPAAGAKWAIGTAHDIVWTESGTFGNGVKLEYYNGTSWQPVTGGGADNAGIAGTLVSTNSDGSLTKKFSWTPSAETGLTAGYITANIRVSDANTSNPPASAASGNFTIAGVTVSYTPPDRGGTAVRVGAAGQTISWTHAGASYVKLQYYSPAAAGYVDIAGATALAAGVSGGSFSWTAPDDVGVGSARLKAIAAGSDGTEAASGIEGSVSNVLGTAFTIYGTLTMSGTYNGTSYQVDSATNRVPVAWTGSSSIPSVVFEYTTSNSTPVYTVITSVQGDFYTTATGTTLGYNWAAGSGSAYWQPKVTGSTFWLRLKDGADSQTVSALFLAANYFGVSGVSVSSVSPASPFSAGQAVTVNGAGAGAVTVGVFYAGSLADAQNKTGTIGSIGVVAVAGDDTFTTPWTVPDLIGSTVYLRVENTANTSVFNVAGPYTITGKLTIANPAVTNWVVGDTTQNISGTVTGDIDSIILQYATTAVPVETDWVNLTTAPAAIGNNSGTTAAAWTLTGAFTVPDVISSSFKLRAVDATLLRGASLLAKSAATTVAVTTRGALTITTPAAAWIVGAPATVNWTAKGGLGNIIIEYQSSTDNNLDPWSTFSTVTASTASGGAGTTAVAGSYAWSSVADVVSSEVGASAVQSDPDVFMRVKVTDSDDAAVTATSTAFTARYRAITWKVLDANGNAVTGLNVSEAATTNPVKAAFNVTANTFSGNNTVRYYPDNAATGKDTYTTLFDRIESGTTYSTSSAGWLADSDKTITLTMDTAATAAISYETQINAVYNATNDSIDISSWLTKKGVLMSDITTDPLAAISVNVYDTAGTQLNTSDLGTGKTPNTQAIFSGISFDPAAGLDPSQTYTIKVGITYIGKQYTSVSGFVSPSVFAYEAKIGAIYNSTNDSIMANIWLERSGTTVTDPGDMAFKVSNSAGTVLSSQAFDGYDSTTDTVKDAKLMSGIYTNIEYDPASGLSSTEIYTIKADVVYRGRTYNAVASFSKGELGTISSNISGIQSAQTAQTSTLAALPGTVSTAVSAAVSSDMTTQLGSQTTTLQGNIASQTTTLGSQIGTVGANVTALPAAVSSAVTTAVAADMNTQLAKGIQAELLTRPANAATGTTVPIRFRTASGLIPKITVYDASNVVRVSAAAMTEISTTGIYEYKLTLNTAWGLGDFTVLVTESAKGSTDSLVLHVGLGGLDEIYSKVSSASASSTASSGGATLDTIFAGVTKIQTNTNGLNSDITGLLTRLGTSADAAGTGTVFGKIAAINTSGDNKDAILTGVDEIKNYVDTLETSLGVKGDAKTSETIFGQLAGLEDFMRNLGTNSKEVEAARAKANDLAQLMEEIRVDLASGNMAEASKKLAVLGQGLSSLNSDLSGLPQKAGAASVGKTFEDLKNMAAGGGLEGLVPLLEEIKQSREAFNPENMTAMRNTVEELKSLMTEVRSLLDQEVNKPVVHGWLEEEQE